ncbi:hypothetical protein Zmor_026672 [Zophobas morio]|uniref:Uncharacterized protein n=1 Tax=Zophobas morio TaxID=2755281 RepID=A0AA38HUV5_9CUCU|nr:hypothetical protein Zmor_026672 [Zophobas morio]
MLPEQESLIYKNFVSLVKDCDLEQVMQSLSIKDPSVTKVMDNVKIEQDRRHNNRCFLFQLLKVNSSSVFDDFVDTLREYKYEHVADKLQNKTVVKRPPHITSCVKLPDKYDEPLHTYVPAEQLNIEVKYATNFCDMEDCYRTRSKNRGQVLIINNILFDMDSHQMRRGAEVDENNLKELFEKIGFSIEIYRNLPGEEIKSVTEKFSQKEYENNPDVGIVIIMSHGEKVDNKTVIIGSDGKGVEEEWIIRQFNNQTCALFRNKPKILIFNICRGELVDNLAQFAQHTQCDSACTKKPDIVDKDERYYSDLIICHPSVEGFQAHRDTVRGCWYIELICKVFMENSDKIDVESMLKMVERGLKSRISEKMTRQTSTFLNIAFRNCYLNPGIYEEDGVVMKFKQSL